MSFALDVGDLVRDLGDEDRKPISVSAGIDSGPVTVGLTGISGLIYDAWGSTVQHAADLARFAEPGGVFVSAAVRSQLPSSILSTDAVGPAGSPDAAVVSRQPSEGEQVR